MGVGFDADDDGDAGVDDINVVHDSDGVVNMLKIFADNNILHKPHLVQQIRDAFVDNPQYLDD